MTTDHEATVMPPAEIGPADNDAVALKEVREEWNKIDDESPTVAQRFVDQAMKIARSGTGDMLHPASA